MQRHPAEMRRAEESAGSARDEHEHKRDDELPSKRAVHSDKLL